MKSESGKPGKRKAKRARDRNLARQQRRLAMMERGGNTGGAHTLLRRYFPSYNEDKLAHRALAWLFSSRSPVAKLTALVTMVVVVFFVSNFLMAGRIFPNVYAMGVAVGEMTPEEAEIALRQHWDFDVHIDITVDGQVLKKARPDELGLSIDISSMANAARAAGVAGIPFGISIEPQLTVSHSRAQSLLLDFTEAVYVPQYEAGYRWSGGRLIAVPGRRGRHLDVTESMRLLKGNAANVVSQGRLELQTIPLNPIVFDSTPFLGQAIVFLQDDVHIRGYDPFKDHMLSFAVDKMQAAEWLTAGENGLSVRENAFRQFVDSLNRELVRGGRYIDELQAISNLQEALISGTPEIALRLNYLPEPYSVVQKDTGFRIGRKAGIPYELIRDANPTVNWNALVVGQEIQIPSRDVLLPQDPVPHKRIIVDLQSQWLVAFENNDLLFSWGISSGRETAPTYPGIFQILTHNPKSFGSSYALCSDLGTNCNQWEMFWFMGIYEVVPGLMNGFHGAVRLPNGNLLGGGYTYEPTTFGCIMSLNSRAKELYDWAETGTVVEIVSEEFAPESELARLALEFISTIDTNYRPIE
ncbi:MAG: L,D-transpeptidase family protein [Chloroflexi bacterium]|nr:L,D-transpeptidase family protein [Chloroflexota bacterium]